MNALSYYFERKKRDQSNASEDEQEFKKQHEVPSPSRLEMSQRCLDISDRDDFKESLESEDCVVILQECMQNIESKIEGIMSHNPKHERQPD